MPLQIRHSGSRTLPRAQPYTSYSYNSLRNEKRWAQVAISVQFLAIVRSIAAGLLQQVTIVTLHPGRVGFHCTRKLVTEFACMRRIASNSPLFWL